MRVRELGRPAQVARVGDHGDTERVSAAVSACCQSGSGSITTARAAAFVKFRSLISPLLAKSPQVQVRRLRPSRFPRDPGGQLVAAD